MCAVRENLLRCACGNLVLKISPTAKYGRPSFASTNDAHGTLLVLRLQFTKAAEDVNYVAALIRLDNNS